MSSDRIGRPVRCGRRTSAVALAALLASAGGALAADTVGFSDKPGTKAPPAKLHGFAMSKFGPDKRSEGATVKYVKGPTGRIRFAPPTMHAVVPSSWPKWSNGYKGSVYFEGFNDLRITLPSGTKAFYFYLEPDFFGTWKVTATADGASSGPVKVTSSKKKGGAKYFGFFAETPGANVTSIYITIPAAAMGFAVGEFGIR
jgi:hypothetical protein